MGQVIELPGLGGEWATDAASDSLRQMDDYEPKSQLARELWASSRAQLVAWLAERGHPAHPIAATSHPSTWLNAAATEAEKRLRSTPAHLLSPAARILLGTDTSNLPPT